MAQLLQAFDASQVKPDQGIGGLPVGKYPVVIESSEVKPTKGNDGGLIEFILKVTEGEHKGSIGAYRINLYNSNAQAVQIAQKQFSALCHVTGVFMVQDTQQLHGIPFIVEVTLQKGEEAAKNGYTEVKRVFDMNGNEPGKQSNQQLAAQQQQPAQQQAPAWGQQQPQQPAAQGWQQNNGGNAGAAPWGQR